MTLKKKRPKIKLIKKNGKAAEKSDKYYINRLVAKDWTIEQVAEEIGCSVPTVYRTLRLRGLTGIKNKY